MTRLNVGKVVVGAFLIPWLNRKNFAKALSVPLLLILGLTISWHYSDEYLSTTVRWGLYLLYVVLFVVIAVTCHRLVLLDTQKIAFQYKITWSSRETRFFGWVIAVACIQGIIASVLAGFFLNVFGQWLGDPDSIWPKWVLFAAKIPAFYVCARCFLVFPAIALNRPVSFKWAWNLSKKNGWRLVALMAVLPWLISHAINFLYRDNATVIENVLLTLLGFMSVAVEVAAISLAYSELIKGEENDGLGPDLLSDMEEPNR